MGRYLNDVLSGVRARRCVKRDDNFVQDLRRWSLQIQQMPEAGLSVRKRATQPEHRVDDGPRPRAREADDSETPATRRRRHGDDGVLKSR